MGIGASNRIQLANMKILFALPGHLKTVPMGQFCVEALTELGHTVIPFDFSTSLRDKLLDRWTAFTGLSDQEARPSTNGHLRNLIDDTQPDLFIALFGFDISKQSLAYLKQKRISSACWWINDPFQFQRSLKQAPYYDLIFSNSAGSVEQYRAAGIKHAYFLPTACHPALHRPVLAKARYRCDVCFAGDWSPLRERVLTGLAELFDVKIFGPWRKKLAADSKLHRNLTDGFFTPDEMAQMFSSAKIVFNIHTWYGTHDHGVNPRLFEAAGCGAFQVVDWKQEIPTLFDCDTEVKCYRTLDEIAPLITQGLASAETRQAMAKAAHRRAYGEHTYRHRMQKLLETAAKANSDHS